MVIVPTPPVSELAAMVLRRPPVGGMRLACVDGYLGGRRGRGPGRRLRARADWAGYAPHLRRWAAQEDAVRAVDRTREHADVVVENGV
jgi:hypothetical protein